MQQQNHNKHIAEKLILAFALAWLLIGSEYLGWHDNLRMVVLFLYVTALALM